MPCEDSWLIPNRVLLLRYYDLIGFDEVRTSIEVINRYAGVAKAFFCVVFDSRDVQGIQFSTSSLHNVMKLHRLPNLVSAIFVQKSTILRFLASLTVQIAHAERRYFSTLAEAEDYLRRINAYDSPAPALLVNRGTVRYS